MFLVAIFYPSPSVSRLRKAQINTHTHTHGDRDANSFEGDDAASGFKYHPVVSLTMGCLVSPNEIRLLSGFLNWIPISPNREENSLNRKIRSRHLCVLFFLCTFRPFNIAPLHSDSYYNLIHLNIIKHYSYFLRFNQFPHSL